MTEPLFINEIIVNKKDIDIKRVREPENILPSTT